VWKTSQNVPVSLTPQEEKQALRPLCLLLLWISVSRPQPQASAVIESVALPDFLLHEAAFPGPFQFAYRRFTLWSPSGCTAQLPDQADALLGARFPLLSSTGFHRRTNHEQD
jgi:hypothetical protein